MSFKLSALSLFAIGALLMNGAIAQPSAAPICAESVQGNLISVRLSEQGSALVEVKTNTEGNVRECRIVKSAGSVAADKTSCTWVEGHLRSLKRCQDH